MLEVRLEGLKAGRFFVFGRKSAKVLFRKIPQEAWMLASGAILVQRLYPTEESCETVLSDRAKVFPVRLCKSCRDLAAKGECITCACWCNGGRGW